MEEFCRTWASSMTAITIEKKKKKKKKKKTKPYIDIAGHGQFNEPFPAVDSVPPFGMCAQASSPTASLRNAAQ